jgi:hypothetical protein
VSEPFATEDYLFLLLFPAFWLAVTTLLGVMAGWFELQDLYPDRDEEPSDCLRFVSGAIGRGSLLNPWGNVSYGGCLSLDVCRGGLRVRVWRIFAAFQKPIYVPWPCITVEMKHLLFFPRYRLEFARTDGRALIISKRAFDRIARTGLLKQPINV